MTIVLRMIYWASKLADSADVTIIKIAAVSGLTATVIIAIMIVRALIGTSKETPR